MVKKKGTGWISRLKVEIIVNDRQRVTVWVSSCSKN